MADDRDPALLAFADLARRLEPRVTRVTTRIRDGTTVPLIELVDATRGQVEALAEALRAQRPDLAADFIVTSKPEMPKGWPPG